MKHYKTSEAQYEKMYLGYQEKVNRLRSQNYVQSKPLSYDEFKHVYEGAKMAGETKIVDQLAAQSRIVSYSEAEKIYELLKTKDTGTAAFMVDQLRNMPKRQAIYAITSGDAWLPYTGTDWQWGHYTVQAASPWQAWFAWLAEAGLSDDINADYGY